MISDGKAVLLLRRVIWAAEHHRPTGNEIQPWRIGTEIYGDRDILPRDVISRNHPTNSSTLKV